MNVILSNAHVALLIIKVRLEKTDDPEVIFDLIAA